MNAAHDGFEQAQCISRQALILMMKPVPLMRMKIMPFLSGNAYARELFPDLSQGHISRVRHFLNQPQCHSLAKFLTPIRMLRMNKA